jgi:hypothetical protein
MRGTVLVILLTTAWARAQSPEADALLVLDRGIALYEKGELEKAKAAFIVARDLVPDKPNPRRWLGLTEARLHHCREALVELEVFLSRAPDDDPRRGEVAIVRDRCRDELATPPPIPPPVIVAPPQVAAAAPPPPAPHRRSRAWIAGVVVGVVAVGVGLGVGLGLGLPRERAAEALPAIMGAP